MRLLLTIIKNEEDIIQFFVEHNLKFIDKIYIGLHNSNAKTKEVVAKITNFYENVFSMEINEEGFNQSKIATDFYHKVSSIEDQIEIVCFLDADEILLSDESFDYLKKEGDIIRSNRYEVLFLDSTLNRVSKKLQSKKSFFYHDSDNFLDYYIGTGQHYIYKNNKTKGKRKKDLVALKENVERIEPFILHIPYRSINQILSKVVIGWTSYLTSNPEYLTSEHIPGTHWRNLFNHFSQRNFNLISNDIEKILYNHKYKNLELSFELNEIFTMDQIELCAKVNLESTLNSLANNFIDLNKKILFLKKNKSGKKRIKSKTI